MSLGNSLFNVRKKSGLSQEDVAEKLGVSSKQYPNRSLDFDIDVKEIEQIIENINEKTEQKIDWTNILGENIQY